MATNGKATNATPLKNAGSVTPRRDHAKKGLTAPATPVVASPVRVKRNTQKEIDDVKMLTSKMGATDLSEPQSPMTRGTGGTTVKKPQLKLWEQEIVQGNAEVKRKATIAQLCEYLLIEIGSVA